MINSVKKSETFRIFYFFFFYCVHRFELHSRFRFILLNLCAYFEHLAVTFSVPGYALITFTKMEKLIGKKKLHLRFRIFFWIFLLDRFFCNNIHVNFLSIWQPRSCTWTLKISTKIENLTQKKFARGKKVKKNSLREKFVSGEFAASGIQPLSENLPPKKRVPPPRKFALQKIETDFFSANVITLNF